MHRIRKNHRYGTKGICLLLAAMLAVSAVGCRKEEAVSLEEADFSLEEEGQETGSEEVAGSEPPMEPRKGSRSRFMYMSADR